MKRFISFLTAFSITLMLLPWSSNIAEAATVGGCNVTHSGMTAWSNTTSLPTDAGSYYLINDVNLTASSTISKNITLCLNGHTITAASNKRIFYINENCTLTLCDCKETGKLIGSDISNNSGADSGGVIAFNGTFIMNGGTISGGKAKYGGGVTVNSTGTFIMNGGTISGNEATTNSGGGVHLISGGSTFNMNGGTISNNTAAVDGSGVNMSSGSTFTMTGGTITGNIAKGTDGGGIWVSSSATAVTLNGNVNITGNTKNSSANNVYLAGGKTLTIGSNFSSSSKVGVTASATGDCKNYVDVTGTTTKDVSSSFTADSGKQTVVYNSSKVQLSGAHGTATHTAAKAATCTADGNVEYWTCSVCKNNYDSSTFTNKLTTTVVEKTGHTYSTDWTTNDTQHWHVCTKCGEADTKTNHSWGTGTVTTAATCTATGVRTYTCTCGETKTETIAKTAHSYSTAWTTDGNQHWHVCTECGTAGTKTNHTWDSGKVTTEPTCTAKGVKTITCTACKKTKTEDIAATNHSYGNWSVTKNPTLTATGTAERICSNDNTHKETKNLPILTDTSVWTKDTNKSKPATEESAGEDVYTSEYGEVKVTVEKLSHSHDWSDWKITRNPNFTENGTASRICSKDLSHIETKDVPKLSANGWTKSETKNPTVNENG